MAIWIWLVAPFIGLVLGLFGAGGGMLSVPVLVYGAGLPIKEAIVLSLWFVGVVSVVAALHQRVWRVLQPKLLITFAAGGVSGAVAGARLAGVMPDWLQQLLFALLLGGVSLWLYFSRKKLVKEAAKPCHCALAFFGGMLVGALTGILGVGAGFLMVPLLIMMGVSHLPTAVAHSLVLISLNAVAAGIAYVGTVSIDMKILLPFVLLASLGAFVGGYLLKRLPVDRVQGAFAGFLVCLSIVMIADLIF